MTDEAPITAGSWRALLGPNNLGASTVLAGGVALYATNEFLTISLMPSAVGEIGGHRLYTVVTTVYLVASVVAATTVHSTLLRFGPRRSYLAAVINTVDPAEGPAAAAAINTVQLISGALGAGLAGVVVNLTETGDATPARWLFAAFAALAAVGVIASVRSGRQPQARLSPRNSIPGC